MAADNVQNDLAAPQSPTPPLHSAGRPDGPAPMVDDARFDRAALAVTLIGAFLLLLPFLVYVYVRLTRH